MKPDHAQVAIAVLCRVMGVMGVRGMRSTRINISFTPHTFPTPHTSPLN
ncbi:hypothetical protein [Fischerella sp. NIES-3754]|nr:hypothetical protein [Fischerella sp. NIES-3754]